MRLLGYTRVSTATQDAQLQRDALVADGVQQRDIFSDVTSGSKTAATRPGIRRLLDYAEQATPSLSGESTALAAPSSTCSTP